MKTTRRRLLGLISLGAAAAALVPTQTEAAAAAEPVCCGGACPGQGAYERPVMGSTLAHEMGAPALSVSGNLSVTDKGLVIRPSAGRELARWDADGNLVYIADEVVSDAIAQARADGYNRGREVEMARQEARHNDPYSLHMPVVG